MSRPICLICGHKEENHCALEHRCPDYSKERHERTQRWSKTDKYVPNDGILSLLLQSLGWQGGTIHEAIAEVRRLVEVKKTAMFYTSDWNGANHNDPEIARLAVERLANLHDLLVLKSRA